MIEARAEFDTWEETKIPIGAKTSGQIKTTCPQCSHNRKPHNRKEACLRVNLDDKVFNCFNCDWSGYVRRFPKRNDSRYDKPDYRPNPVSEKMKAWFWDKRRLNEQTLNHFMVYPHSKWMPQLGQELPSIAFPYIDGTAVVNIKSRHDYFVQTDEGKKAMKTFAMEKGAKKILYNLNAIKGQKKVMITEGEIDAMSVWQSGFKAVCSVPNGAPPLKNDEHGQPLPLIHQPQINLDYLDNAAIDFANAEEIIIATDGDLVGQRLRNEIARRLGKARCKFVNWPEGYKDFNQVLVDFGEEGVQQVLEEYIESFPVEGIVTVEDVLDDFIAIWDKGYPKGATLSHKRMNELITWRGGEVTTITGIPGHGKSEFVDEVLIELAERHNWPSAVFAAENGGAALHTARLVHRYMQKPVVEDVKKNLFPKMTREEAMKGAGWVNSFFRWIDLRQVGQSLDSILDKAKELVVNRGIKVLVIDPWNYLEGSRPHGQTETEWVSEQYSKLVFFAEEHDVHVIIVAHPVKMQQNDDNTYKIPTLYSIAGSANFYNKTFNGLVVYREGDITTIYVQKVKFDFIGHTGSQEFRLDTFKKRYYEI